MVEIDAAVELAVVVVWAGEGPKFIGTTTEPCSVVTGFCWVFVD